MKNIVFVIVLSIFLSLGVFGEGQEVTKADSTAYFHLGEYTKTKTLEEVFQLLVEKSPKVRQTKYQIDSKVLEYDIASDAEEEYKSLYLSSKNYDSISSLREQYLSMRLNREQLYFYHKYRMELIDSEMQKIKYDWLNMFYQLVVLEKQKEYYMDQAEYLNVYKAVVDIKCRYGRCTQMDVEQVSMQVDENKSYISDIESAQEELKNKIENELGNSIDFCIDIPWNSGISKYEFEEVKKRMETNDYSYEEAVMCKEAYFNCNNSDEMFRDSFTYKKNKNAMEQYSIKAKSIQEDVVHYAKATITKYRQYCNKATTASGKLKISMNKYNNEISKYRKGKSSKLNILDAKVKKSEAEYKYFSQIYNKLLCEYVLENGIYIVTQNE